MMLIKGRVHGIVMIILLLCAIKPAFGMYDAILNQLNQDLTDGTIQGELLSEKLRKVYLDFIEKELRVAYFNQNKIVTIQVPLMQEQD
jgi:hypothetical protein